MKTKILYKIVIGLSLSFGVLSCSDKLDLMAPDRLTSSNFWRNASDAEAGLASVYSKLEVAIDTWEFAEVKFPVEAYREDICEIGADALNYQTWVELYNFTYTNGNSQFSTYWRNYYQGISYANQVIEKVPGIDMDAKQRSMIVAEAKFLRAYYHMKLLLNWEKIIIRDSYITGEDQINKELSERVVTWDFIVKDLEDAVIDLELKHSATNVGRASKGAGYAYLGYVYLTRAYEESARKEEMLDKAEKALRNVTGYSLENDFISMFDGTNSNSQESIFELQFTENTANGASYRTALHKWISTWELDGWDEILPSKMLIAEFKKEGKVSTTGRYDSRLYHTLFLEDPYFNDPSTPRIYGYTYDEWFSNGSERSSFRKYLPATIEDLYKSRTAINLPLMRYADVLLLLAETLNEQGKTGDAIPLINEVRKRADMPSLPLGLNKQEVRERIEHERIVEFPLENTRFYDLRRWGKTKEALHAIGRTGFDPQKHNFYPIPLVEVMSNDKLSQ
ncbi:RagB/SusD family nutrient uptake outer membrane protein [Sphingobacterium sp. UT-1RO-CII-1]|uniref:RagB/SusD family nutrient uptake outer membrane protein n=1 Tax=Sphingobacterium sp. UT-1RO-CII-1 TaxID=2995225 RepID=UPI00227D2D33|nr:RagB/SusD family nutrient uptake outer membrane protein [Sphingobacterium sp. UT-1RO-CII-1]MCY4780159.1 RagB/SusD family nutrient uptake outer membrane protein [Sphingobacterium sp. UT-1RO-CII-1]